jgi:transcriptional regulator with XRE-family HTH domain
MAVSLTAEKLASHIGCTAQDIYDIETGSGSFPVLMRTMDALKFDLTGLKPGVMLPDRLRMTREARKWSVEKLAARSNLSLLAITALEHGTGSVEDLLKVLMVLAPRYGRRASPYGKAACDKDSRFTPQHVLTSIEEAFGSVSLDPCADARSPVRAVNRIEKATGGDGLAQDWFGELVFVNPPYSASSQWLRRMCDQWQKGKIETLLCLVNAKTDAGGVQAALKSGVPAFIFASRLKYGKPDGTKESSQQPSMMLAFGTNAVQRAVFARREKGIWVVAQR